MNTNLVKVLLVEDSPTDSRLLKELLRDQSIGAYDVQVAESLAAAIECIGQATWDVILLDLSLPDSQGTETYEAVRETTTDLPIVILTGLNDQMLGMKLVEEGAQDYLVKGQGDGELIARALRYAIERNSQRLELLELQEKLLEAERVHAAAATAIGAAHEIRQPLTLLKGNAELLGMGRMDEQKRSEMLQEIVEASDRINTIIQKMFQVRKFVTTKYAGGPDMVDFDAAADEEGAESET